MSIIKALSGSFSSVMSDQWKEFFYCDSLPANVMIVKGTKRVNQNSANADSDENVISDGSCICVADGQCALVIEQGKVICEFSEPGEHTFHSDRSPSLLNGSSPKSIAKEIGYRFTFGGNVVPLTQRIYYINTKECSGNSFSLPTSIPVHITDRKLGLDLDASLICSGCYSFKITKPSIFYKNVSGNVKSHMLFSQIANMMHSEILTELPIALHNAFQKGIRPYDLPSKTDELCEIMNQSMSERWKDFRGIEIVSFAFDQITLNGQHMQDITSLQKLAVLTDPTMAAAQIVDAQSVSMKMAASNKSNTNGFVTFHLQCSPSNVQSEQPSKKNVTKPSDSSAWTCKCGNTCTSKFCSKCGSSKPVIWTCKCGNSCSTKFCTECGAPKPVVWTCKCGNSCSTKFCTECGAPKPAT